MTNHYADGLDGLFRSLADPTRRAVVARLAEGPAPVSALAAPFDMALPSFLQHIKVLEQGGLVVSEKKGRTRICRLRPERLSEATEWLARQCEIWEARLDRLEALIDGQQAAAAPDTSREEDRE